MSAGESDPGRDAIHEAIQAHGPGFEAGGAVLTGWVLAAEWMDENGERWISRCWAAHTSEWTAKGMMHQVLFGAWPQDEDEDG